MKFDDLWNGEMTRVKLGPLDLLVIRVDDDVFVYSNRCAHLDLPLDDGELETSATCVLTCRAHGWQYDARTGEGLNPRGVKLRHFPVRIENGDIFVECDTLRPQMATFGSADGQ